MAQIKITKEELKHDEFIDATDKFFLWLKRHSTTILVILAGIFAAYSIYLFMQSRQTAAAAGASAIYGQAIADYNSAVAETEWGTIEREQALAEIIGPLDDLQTEYEGTYLAREGLYLVGSAYFSMGDDMRSAREGGGIPNTERAIDAFTRYAGMVEPGTFEQARGLLGLGYANENAFFLTNEQTYLNDALQTYSEVWQVEEAGFLADEARMAAARIRAYVQNDEEGAIELYREVMDNRWRPAPALPEEPTEADQLRQELSRQFQMISLAESARIELIRLGVDVEAEYPSVEGGSEE